MDTFHEQIVAVKKTAIQIVLFFVIWLLAFCGTAFMIINPILRSFSILVIAGLIYGAYKLTSLFNIEYEYIVTNGTMDVDKITNKSSRRRITTFELPNVTTIRKYDAAVMKNINNSRVITACTVDSENTYVMTVEKEGATASYVVFTPNDKMKDAILKFVPRFVANEAFL